MATSKGSNCKDDLDSFLFNLESIKSAGSNLSIKTRMQKDIPVDIQPFMNMSNLPSLCEANVLGYIGGYIIKKISNKLCGECISNMQTSQSPDTPEYILINEKQYQGCEQGGLKIPSASFLEALKAMESLFKSVVAVNLHQTGIRARIVSCLLGRNLLSECHSTTCKFYITALFTNIRLHYYIRCLNQQRRDLKKSKKRKYSIFNHC